MSPSQCCLVGLCAYSSLFHRSSKNGVAGYRLVGNELHIYENEQLTTGTEKRQEIKNSIKQNFNGQVHFRSLHNVLKPQCTVMCGDCLKNKRLGIKGTIGDVCRNKKSSQK